jgi:hypothetical protein
MDLARLRGMSLADAGTLVGKVWSGNVGILSRYGIQLERGTTATQALAEIQRRAQGQAEAYAETTQGKLVRAQIALENAMESLGMALLPVVGQFAELAAEHIPDIVTGIGDIVQEIGRFDPAFERVLNVNDAFDALEERLGLTNGELDESRAKWTALARESDLVTGTVEELTAAFYGENKAMLWTIGHQRELAALTQRTGQASGDAADDTEELDDALTSLAEGSLPEVRKEAAQTAREIRRLLGQDDPPTLKNIRSQIEELERLRDKASLADDELAFSKAVVGIKRLQGQRDAILDARGAARRHADALRDTALADIKAALAAGNEAKARRIAARVTETHKDKTALLKDALNSLPSAKQVNISTPGLNTAITNVEALKLALSTIPSQVPGVGAGRGVGGRAIFGAQGAAFSPGSWGLVGEEGPERVANIGGTTYVYPMGGGGGGRGGVTVNLRGATFLGSPHEGQRWAREVAPVLIREMRRLGA